MKKGRKKSNTQVCGKSVLMHRLAHLMSQGEMANKIGISARTLAKIENEDDFQASPVTAYKIAYELIFNPATNNPEVIKLINSWQNRTGRLHE